MSRLPAVKPPEVIKALQKAGFIIHHIKGSHYTLKQPETGRRVTVPYHRREMKPGTLANIIRQAGLTKEEFLKLLR